MRGKGAPFEWKKIVTDFSINFFYMIFMLSHIFQFIILRQTMNNKCVYEKNVVFLIEI